MGSKNNRWIIAYRDVPVVEVVEPMLPAELLEEEDVPRLSADELVKYTVDET